MTDLSQIIEDALDAEGGEQLYNEEDFCCGVAINTSGLADRLAATVTAHFLEREKVRDALDQAMIGVGSYVEDYEGNDLDPRDLNANKDRYIGLDGWVDLDRLIAALAGGGE